MEPLAELAHRVVRGEIPDAEALEEAKREACRLHGLDKVPRNFEILRFVPEADEAARTLLRAKPVRTASGVAVVAVMTSPAPCPHGRCVYCPGGVDWGTPQSYLGTEPAARRAARHQYDPRAQTEARLRQLAAIGHPTDKVDLIILGGTFTSRSRAYLEPFVKGCFDALNGREARTLEEAHHVNEGAAHRCTGLTVETKPDCFLGPEVEQCLDLGVTRVELGVQSLYEDVLRRVNRGHGLAEVVRATKRAKDAGLKVGYHMMPGLPGSDYERDLRALRELFEHPAYRPDMLKVYPTLVLEGTGLHRLWLRGEYQGMGTEEAARLLAEAKPHVPPYVRILRVHREIAASDIEAGVTKGHLRQLVRERMAAQGTRCRCIRCREAGLRRVEVDPGEVTLGTLRYEASGGEEVFLSYEDFRREVLVGYARVRLCETGAFLRELKVFGQMVPFRQAPGRRWQHRGYGKALMVRAEREAADAGFSRLKVTSGAGVRGYYRVLGYRLEGPYMVKDLP
ncbi:MAG: tRNA uridine(34) 5-carboxymethylaminomethyl modification radical SAM/GNAT enzyme Elp3 [Thermoplasmata archaeon]